MVFYLPPRCCALQDVAKEMGIPGFDFVKIDIEGAHGAGQGRAGGIKLQGRSPINCLFLAVVALANYGIWT